MKLQKLTTVAVLALILTFGVAVSVHAQQGPRNLQVPREDKKLPEPKPLADKAREMRGTKMENASSTASTTMFRRDGKELKTHMAKKMEGKQFEMRKGSLIRELTKGLEHLSNIVVRVESRITKAESSGRNMTEPKALLVIAKQKIDKATVDVNAFKNLIASSTPPTGTATTTEVDLSKPRQLGDVAIKSVKEARDALQKVVVSIAHNMGLGNGDNASSTPKKGPKTPGTGTTTPPVATTTPPTTATTTATTTSN